MIQGTQTNLDTLQSQISSGLKAQTYGGLGGAATFQSLTLNAQANQLDSINTAIDNATNITSTMDSSMTDITTAATTVSSAMQAMVQDSDPNFAVISQEAQNALGTIQTYLNSQTDGVYVFAAGDSTTEPVANTTSLNTAVQTDLAAYMAGTETPATVLSNVAAYTSTQMGYSATLAAAPDVTVPTSPNSSANYTVKASNTGFQSVMQGLSIIANLQYNASDEAGFYQIYNGALNMITQGTTDINNDQANLGITTAAMGTAQTNISATQTILNNSITNVQQLSQSDLTAASTQLTNLQTQLQTSYTIIGQLQSLHLVNYLSG
jgi:flagellar hook-associated protein 3 FlgL